MTIHHHITWDHMLTLEQCGHDKFLPELDDLRFTMASIREHFAAQVGDVARRGEQDRLSLTATLDRVRAAYDYAGNHWADWGERALTVQEMLDAALAGQPEAPKGQAEDGPDADEPKARIAELETHLAGANALLVQNVERLVDANARIAELEAEANNWKADRHEMANALHRTSVRLTAANARIAKAEAEADARVFSLAATMQAELDAAKARNAKLESLFQQTHGCHVSWVQRATEADAANARADEAERDRDLWKDLWVKEKNRADAAERDEHAASQRANRLARECDQLAARAEELESLTEALRHELSRDMARECTPEERNVLEALSNAGIFENQDGTAELYDSDEDDVCQAELANRAAKAKRGG